MKKLLIILTLVIPTLFSCSKYPGYKKTDSGLYYKIYTDLKDAPKAKMGDVLTLKMKVWTKDSVLFNTTTIPFPYRIQLVKPNYPGDYLEGFTFLAKGDSASFILNQDSVFKGNQKPPFIKAEDILYMNVKIENIQNREDYEKEEKLMMQQQQAAGEQLKIKETEDLNKYLNDNNIKVKPSATGLYYIEKVKGRGVKAENGKTVSVHYTGTLLDGTKFDSSIDRNKPFEFVLGQGQVIKGWDEGIALMKIGGKARLVIPSSIGYGERGSGPIPAYAPLVFDVELLDVK